MKIAVPAPFTPSVLSKWLPALSGSDIPKGMGGIAIFDLVIGLLERDHEVHVITLEPGLAQPVSYVGEKASIHFIPRRLRGSSRVLWNSERKMMVDVLKRINPDVVHAHLTYEYALAALDFDPNKTLITAHDSPLEIQRYSSVYYLPQFLASHLVYSRVKWLSGVAPVITDYARRFMKGKTNIHVVPNIMPTNPDISLGQINIPKPYMVTLAHWGARKNIKTSLKAFQHLRRAYPHYQYALIGGGLEIHGPAYTWALKNSMVENVHFLGQQPRALTLNVLAEAVLNLHPSRWEAHCMAIGEAMGLGIPVVAGEKSGGVPWQLDYGQAGCLVDVESVDAMAEGMQKVLDNRAYREKLVARAKNKVEREHSTSAVVGTYEDIYRAISKQQNYGSVERGGSS